MGVIIILTLQLGKLRDKGLGELSRSHIARVWPSLLVIGRTE